MLNQSLSSMPVAIAVLLTHASLAPADTTRVNVRDINGNPIVSAKVIGSWNQQVFSTDRKGRVKLKGVPRSSFSLIVQKAGFDPFKREFNFSKKRQHTIRVTLKKKTAPISPPGPPKKKTHIKSFDASFSLYGSKYWRLTMGDGDVWTDKNKFTRVEMEVDVKPKDHSSNELELSVRYFVWEGSGGDGTLFQGVHTQRLAFHVPKGMKIIGLQAKNSRDTSKKVLKYRSFFYRNGKVHGAQNHNTPDDSFVKNLNYTIDSFRYDNEDIGISGTLHLQVHLQED